MEEEKSIVIREVEKGSRKTLMSQLYVYHLLVINRRSTYFGFR